jgi:hypothetical protein
MPFLFILLLASTSAAFGQAPDSRGTIVVPQSSVERPQDAGKRMHTNIVLFDLGPSANPSFTSPRTSRDSGVNPQAGPTSGKFFETPASLACVYGLTTYVAGCSPAVVTENPAGGSRALAIVDSYDDPNAAADLAAFDLQFGIPAANFQVVYATGAKPPVDPTGGWELEESLDIEWAHAMAPNAALFLVEAASNKKADLLTAVSVASALVAQAGGGEVSMSWGTAESPKEAASESYFATPGVVYFASSGDSPGALWPSVSPSVVSSGGTTVSRNPTTGAFQLEVAWASTGSGPSAYFPIPSYQSSVAAIVGKNRGTPDLAFDADPPHWSLDIRQLSVERSVERDMAHRRRNQHRRAFPGGNCQCRREFPRLQRSRTRRHLLELRPRFRLCRHSVGNLLSLRRLSRRARLGLLLRRGQRQRI